MWKVERIGRIDAYIECAGRRSAFGYKKCAKHTFPNIYATNAALTAHLMLFDVLPLCIGIILVEGLWYETLGTLGLSFDLNRSLTFPVLFRLDEVCTSLVVYILICPFSLNFL